MYLSPSFFNSSIPGLSATLSYSSSALLTPSCTSSTDASMPAASRAFMIASLAPWAPRTLSIALTRGINLRTNGPNLPAFAAIFPKGMRENSANAADFKSPCAILMRDSAIDAGILAPGTSDNTLAKPSTALTAGVFAKS